MRDDRGEWTGVARARSSHVSLSSPWSSVGGLTTSRFDLPHLVLKHRDPRIDRLAAGRGSACELRSIELIDPRGSEECAHVVWGEAVQLFKQKATPLL